MLTKHKQSKFCIRCGKNAIQSMSKMSAFSFSVQDREYYRGASGPLLARIYQPAGAGPFPCVIDVHGGGWGTGDRLNNVFINEYLARSGIVVAAIDFRLSGQAAYPASVIDTNLGIRWLKSIALELGAKPDLVGGLGSSSGGHQLLLNALRPIDPRYSSLENARFPGIDASLRFVVALWPVADPWARFEMARDQSKDALIRAHAAYWSIENEMLLGSPQRILERNDQTHLPPLLVMQGTADDNLPPDMAKNLAVAYRKAGGNAKLTMLDGAPHAFITKDPGSAFSSSALSEITDFIILNSSAG